MKRAGLIPTSSSVAVRARPGRSSGRIISLLGSPVGVEALCTLSGPSLRIGAMRSTGLLLAASLLTCPLICQTSLPPLDEHAAYRQAGLPIEERVADLIG